ncbi:hypothetical protein [Sphingobacterium prati]|uniref:hypothetical protein n=1 Tax=Sphingobacterium prati TaxID=2737006 RepID=UPI001554846E|nr:hypothetical protein [Sphingobacterium prati]NPE46310.1 hypothetical protein [Sphingobacterium prati]
MQRLYKRRKAIFNICRFAVSIVGSYIVLSYGEPEGFLEIFREPGFGLQLTINTIGFFVLSLFISWLMNWQRPMVSKLKYGAMSWILLFLKGFLIPVTVLLILSYTYFYSFGKPFSLSTYSKVIFPISLLVIFVFVGFELILFGMYYSMVLARNARMLKLQRPALGNQSYREDDPDDTFGKFYKIELVERYAVGFDRHGEEHKLPYRTLKRVKELIGEDPRFFSTANWVVQYEGIMEFKNDSNSRALKIYLKPPLNGYLNLNKMYKKAFWKWYEASKNL